MSTTDLAEGQSSPVEGLKQKVSFHIPNPSSDTVDDLDKMAAIIGLEDPHAQPETTGSVAGDYPDRDSVTSREVATVADAVKEKRLLDTAIVSLNAMYKDNGAGLVWINRLCNVAREPQIPVRSQSPKEKPPTQCTYPKTPPRRAHTLKETELRRDTRSP
ncbi:hypothetical protein HDU91_007119, partial [Kappamyces sp. JEL0680]